MRADTPEAPDLANSVNGTRKLTAWRQLAVWWAAASRSTHWEAVANATRCPAWQARMANPIAKWVALLPFPWVGSMALRRVRGRSSQVEGACRRRCARALRAPPGNPPKP